jgi:SAM-dependent MidA family methyltransferase
VRDAFGDAGGRQLAAWDRVEREPPTGIERLESPDGAGIEGLVFSYELFDALPVHRLVRHGKELLELLVDVDGEGGFRWVEAPLSAAELADLPRRDLADGQIDALERGLLVTCDYGFETDLLYDPRVRMHGTLACYRAQRVHRDPFVDVGEQDLTAHVDFSLLIEEGERAGLETFVFTRQAPWLAACGILEGMTDAAGSERFEALQLMQLDGMGDEIRVLVQGRGVAWRALQQRLPGLEYL